MLRYEKWMLSLASWCELGVFAAYLKPSQCKPTSLSWRKWKTVRLRQQLWCALHRFSYLWMVVTVTVKEYYSRGKCWRHCCRGVSWLYVQMCIVCVCACHSELVEWCYPQVFAVIATCCIFWELFSLFCVNKCDSSRAWVEDTWACHYKVQV